MTIAAITRKAGPFINETQAPQVGPFPFTFKVFAASDIQVVRSKSSDLEGGSDVLEYGTDYTVSIQLGRQDTAPGGSITLTGDIQTGAGTLLQPGYSLAILSNVPYSQLTSLTNYDRFLPSVLNAVHDRAVANIQQLVERLDRTVSVPATSSQTPEELVSKLQHAADSAEKVASAYAAQAGTSAAASAASAELAKAWATKTDGKVENIDYSAKQYALNAVDKAELAKKWATQTNAPVEGELYGAKYYAEYAHKDQLQSDWAETDTTAKTYIQNKPTIDSELSATSTNAVQNKTVKTAIDAKATALQANIDTKLTEATLRTALTELITEYGGTVPT